MARQRRFIEAIPPGETLAECLLWDRTIQKAIAARLDIPVAKVFPLLKGATELTQEIAQKIEAALGTNAQFWLNLEAHYRKQLEKRERAWIHRQPHANRKQLEKKGRK